MLPLCVGRYVFRPFVATDAPSFVEAVRESMDTVGRWMSWAHPEYSLAEAETWIAHCIKEWEQASSYEFGIFESESQTLIGGCGLNQFNQLNGFCNLGYWVRHAWQGRGAATAAVNALSGFGFAELELVRIEIIVAAGNEASASVARKARALLEGLARNRLKVHGKSTDAYVFSLVPEVGV